MWIVIEWYLQDVQKNQEPVTMICLMFPCLHDLDINVMKCKTVEWTVDFFKKTKTLSLYF